MLSIQKIHLNISAVNMLMVEFQHEREGQILGGRVDGHGLSQGVRDLGQRVFSIRVQPSFLGVVVAGVCSVVQDEGLVKPIF